MEDNVEKKARRPRIGEMRSAEVGNNDQFEKVNYDQEQVEQGSYSQRSYGNRQGGYSQG